MKIENAELLATTLERALAEDMFELDSALNKAVAKSEIFSLRVAASCRWIGLVIKYGQQRIAQGEPVGVIEDEVVQAVTPIMVHYMAVGFETGVNYAQTHKLEEMVRAMTLKHGAAL